MNRRLSDDERDPAALGAFVAKIKAQADRIKTLFVQVVEESEKSCAIALNLRWLNTKRLNAKIAGFIVGESYRSPSTVKNM